MEQITYYLLRATLAILAIVGVSISYTIASFFYERKRTQRLLKDFPGCPPHWLWGNLKEFKRGEAMLTKGIEWRRQYGPVYPVWFGPAMALMMTTHPDYVKVILNTTEPKNKIAYSAVMQWIGDGLLVTGGQKWKRNRRLLTPAFHFDILRPYVKVFSDCGNVMVKKWRQQLEKPSTGPFEMFDNVSLMTLDSLLKCVMGYHGPSVQLADGKNEYINTIYQLAEATVTRLRSPFLRNETIWRLSSAGKTYTKLCDKAHQFTRGIIDQKKEEIVRGGVNGDKADSNNNINNKSAKRQKCLDFIDMLLRARDNNGNGLTDDEIQAEMDTFMFEGHDTTASGLSWCCYNLANNQQAQDKCREEINEVLGDRDDLTWDDMNKFPYLVQCIKESLRLHPPVPGVSRTLENDLKFPDGRVQPAGTIIQIGIWQVHHNEEIWDNPSEYDPDRFSPENAAGRHPFAFIPFAAGPRNCIGQQFAMTEMKTSMALILKNFRLSVVPDSIPPEPTPELVLRAKSGIWLNVEAL